MTDSQRRVSEGEKTMSNEELQNYKNYNSTLIEDGNPARYSLKLRTESPDESEPYRKIFFGERIKNKPHKTILMLGETGTGKTTLINVMINYMLGVQREDNVWFEITDDQSDRTSAHSQTSSVTVYGFYPQESPINLTIIDTPGYGETRGVEKDQEIAVSLFSLSKSEEQIHEIDAVCLVIKATENRLSDRQQYVFDAVQSLFGRDIAENIVLLFTHTDGMPPKNALKAVKEAKIKSAVNDKNQPVYFLFNNRQSDAADEEYKMMQEQSWNLSFKGMEGLFKFLDRIKLKTLKMTKDVLQQKQLEANINNLISRIHVMELKQTMLEQTLEALKQNKKHVNNNENFEYEVDVPYKEKIPINCEVANEAMSCSVCEENCYYPDFWLVIDLLSCSVMKDEYCTVCTNRCHYTKHIKEAKIFDPKTKKEKRTYDELKKYEKIEDGESMVKKLEEELNGLKIEKIKRLFDAFYNLTNLEMTTLKTLYRQDFLLTLLHDNFLIEKLKEINECEKAETLENIKKRAGEE